MSVLPEIIADHRTEIREVCLKNSVQQLDLVGSAANGTFHEASSDLDFVVTFKELEPVPHANCYFSTIDELESLLGRHVDLIEERAVKNPYFKANIQKERIVLFNGE